MACSTPDLVESKGGEIDLFSSERGQLCCSIPASTSGTGEGTAHAAGLAFLHSQPRSNGHPTLLSCTASGLLRVHHSMGATGDAGLLEWTETKAWPTKAAVACMALDTLQQHVAIGGKGSQLQIWSLATQQRTFQAKGAKPNHIGLVDPAHLTAAAWAPGGREGVLVVGTAEHKICVYDIRAGRRPQLELSWGRSPLTALAAGQDEHCVWAANSRGCMEALDLRVQRMGGALKGSSGSVRSLALHAGQPLIASAGLDRCLRVHSTATRKLLGKLYLKQQLTSVSFLPVAPQPAPADVVPSTEVRARGGEEAASALKKRRKVAS